MVLDQPGEEASPAAHGTDARAMGRFCPIKGMLSSGAVHMSGEDQALLLVRLRAASAVIFVAALAFLVRFRYFAGTEAGSSPDIFFPVHLTLVVGLGLIAGMLWHRRLATLHCLRVFELTIFGLPALLIAWAQFNRGCLCASLGKEYLQGLAAETCIPWIILIFIYGLFIPNRARRAATVMGTFALLPFVALLGTAYGHPEMREVLYDGALSLMVLWMGVPLAAAVYASSSIGALRRQALQAKELGVYRLRQLLGRGGMGEVYLAEHKLLKRPCAVKVIHADGAADPKTLARFESEVQATAHLTHWNTVEIYDYGSTSDGTFYYAMEFLPGLNLQELVDRYGPMSAERAIHLLRQVCYALSEAHSMGLIHRDIKPHNVFAAERGGIYDVAKLLDFGLVKSTLNTERSSKLTMEGTVIGSPSYMAPETAMGDEEPDARSDVYSLGATGYFLVTGQPVFADKKPIKVIFQHAHEPVVPPSQIRPEVPADLEEVLLRCLAKAPSERFANVDQLQQALSQCAAADRWTQAQAVSWWTEIGDLPRIPSDRSDVDQDETVAYSARI